VAAYSIDNGKRTASVPVGSHPESMALSPNQLHLLVVNTASGDMTVLSLIDNKGRPLPEVPALETMIPLGKDPRAIVVKAFVSQR
jgi:DNA-binding beta-propeller fold protein YncE